MTKKKRNARERRALVGALCTAAVIVAGSTFAWFTSSDEVTNRLSANADYNVSIVESFTPPKNWIPGQEINKDVYATNTGNIGAYVEQDVSGVLTITTEKPETNWSAECVELTAEERYVMEAGAYLALAPTGSTTVVGNQVVIRPADNGGSAASTDFTPDVDGLYVFRRSIGVDSTTRAETFEYEGYYYNGGKYYKVELTSVTPDTTADLANDGVTTDGNLTAATATYFKENTEVVSPVALAYDATNNRLVATYDTGNATTNDLVALAQAYDDAIAAYERANEAVNRATADNTATTGTLSTKKSTLDTAYGNLQSKLTELKTADIDLKNKTAAYNNAVSAKAAAQKAVDASKVALYGNAAGGTTELTDAVGGEAGKYTTDSLYGKYQAAANAKVNTTGRDQFEADFNAWVSTESNTTSHTTLNEFTYEEFTTLFVPQPNNQVYYERVAAEKQAKEAYEAELTKLHGSTNTSADATATSLEGKLTAATTALGDNDSGATKDKNTAQTTYDNAMIALYGNKAGGTTALTATSGGEADKYTAGSLYGLYVAALSEYETALTASGVDTTDLATAKADLAAATAAKTAAEKAYTKANGATASDGILKININLSDNVVTAGGVADKWQLLPNPIDTTGADANIAKFFYTSILSGGTTSSKLIESVELDSSATQDMYKSFDFDLNVALKSAQIAYDTDNTTILATPANQELDANATLAQPTNEATPITWTAKS